MSVTLTLNLPDEMVSRLTILPEDQRESFILKAISDALNVRKRKNEEKLAAEIYARLIADTENN